LYKSQLNSEFIVVFCPETAVSLYFFSSGRERTEKSFLSNSETEKERERKREKKNERYKDI
jgi:hypothetical protein